MTDGPNGTADRLHKLERDQLEMRVRLGVLERALWSLAVTHPDPNAFAKNLEEATERATALHLNDELVTDEVREHAYRSARDIVELAKQEAIRRKAAAAALLQPRA